MPKLVLYAAAAIIAAAALPLPYGIYVFIRIIGTIAFAYLAYESWRQEHELLPWAYGAAAMICALIYYLAAIRGWGYLLAIIYCFPSIGLVILSMFSVGIGAISGWLSEKFHRF